MRFLSVEYAKRRRLKVWLVAAVLSLGTLLFASMQLFRSSYVAAINDPAQQHWEGTLLWYAMAKAMTAPCWPRSWHPGSSMSSTRATDG